MAEEEDTTYSEASRESEKIPLQEIGSTQKSHRWRNQNCLARNKYRISVAFALVLVVMLLIVAVALVLVLLLGQPEPWTEVRLPTSLQPLSYTLHLSPNLETMQVQGTVAVTLRANETTEYVILHALDMEIDDERTSVTSYSNSEPLEVKRTFWYPENDFYVVQMSSKVPAGEILVLSLSFSYVLAKDLDGFYNGSYIDQDGIKHVLACTQFESTSARKAFPCFDEPALKANFSISITHDSRYTATSNMPVSTRSPVRKRDGNVTTTFETSVKMSTYLVAFVVSDLECTDPLTIDNRFELRVCSTPMTSDRRQYALLVAEDILKYYEELYQVDYPLPKLDLFAIPDFAVGGMENWGLITFCENCLLYSNVSDSEERKERVNEVIAHELAHQWFGDLVTMEWWDGLWLNEGFASYVEYIGTNHSEPTWKELDQFFVDTLQGVLATDSLNASHPVLQNVSTPGEISSLFDAISYSKGASILRMLITYIGPQAFNTGIRDYLTKYSYSNAETNQLWEAFKESSDVEVTDMMDTWTKQMGYPVVTISSPDSNGRVTITQSRFLLHPLNQTMAPSPFNYVWIIPFTYFTEKDPDIHYTLFNSTQDVITLGNDTAGFIKANREANGFYRVNYDSSNWKKIIDYLLKNDSISLGVLSAVDRANLVDDAFALSSAGLLDLTTALDLSRYLRKEKEYVPWKAGLTWLYTLGGRLSLTNVYGKFQQYVSQLLEDIVSELNFESTGLSHTQIFLRSSVLGASWMFGNEEIAQRALEMFHALMENSSQVIPADLQSVVYSAAIAYGSEDEWNFLWQRYLSTISPDEKSVCLSALAKATEPWILVRYLEYSLTDVPLENMLDVIMLVGKNVYGRDLAWDFFRENWDYLDSVFGEASFSLPDAIQSLTYYFSTEVKLKEVEAFFSNQGDVGVWILSFQQAIETIQGNIVWLNKNQDLLEQWLDSVLS